MYVVGGIGSLFFIGLPILITAIVFTALKTGFEKKVTSEDFKIYQDYIEKNKTLAELDNKIISWCRALFLIPSSSAFVFQSSELITNHGITDHISDK